tara:strand:- start:41554 stop:42504 length:951 start_codon:yes stop_codon:yes gene_type:complete
MKFLLITLLSISSTLFASELPANIYKVLGQYDSEAALNSDTYEANDLSTFNVIITPDSKAQVYFEEYDLEIDLDNDLSFYVSDVNECQDPGCSGVSDIEGSIKLVDIDGKKTPVATITMSFYADISEDVDCDEVDCDNMDYDDYWKEWTETFEYKFVGSIAGQLPTFKPVDNSSAITEVKDLCKNLDRYSYVQCFNADSFEFFGAISEVELNKLREFMHSGVKHEVTKTEMLALVSGGLEHKLQLALTFKYKGVETPEYLAAKEYVTSLTQLLSDMPADAIYIDYGRSYNWSEAPKLEVLIVDQATQSATRFKISL